VEVGKPNSGSGKAIKMRSPVDLRAIATKVSVSEVVRKNEDDVGPSRVRKGPSKLEDETQNYQHDARALMLFDHDFSLLLAGC
jgi:hypothetical protein